MKPLTRIAKLDSGEIYWQLESGSLLFSGDGTRAMAGIELLGCPRWRSFGELGSGPATVRYTSAGIVTTRLGELALWDDFGQLLAALDWTLTTATELSVTSQALVLGSPKHQGLLLCRQQGDRWETLRQPDLRGYPVLCKDQPWLAVFSATLQVEAVDGLRLEECAGPKPTLVAGTISIGPAPGRQDAALFSPGGFWSSCKSYEPPLALYQDGRAHRNWTSGRWQQAAPGQPVLIEWQGSRQNPVERLELREPYLLNEELQPQYERVQLPGPPDSDPLGLVGIWEHYQFHADGTYSELNLEDNTSCWAGTWGLDDRGDYFVLVAGVRAIQVTFLEPQVLQLDRQVVCSKPNLRALPGVWTLSGPTDLPNKIGFSRCRDAITRKFLFVDVQTLQILGEYSADGHDSQGLLLPESGDPVPIQMQGFDEFVLHHGAVVGRRGPEHLPKQFPIPSAARKAAWEEHDRKERIESDIQNKISERNFRIY